MNALFVDTQFWLALINPRDRHHNQAIALRQSVRGRPLLTTNAVFSEVLAFCSDGSHVMRSAGVRLVRAALADPDIETIEMERELFLRGLDLYADRPDKEYSLVDCISMVVMKERGIYEVLTYDHHFTQEGFVALLRD